MTYNAFIVDEDHKWMYALTIIVIDLNFNGLTDITIDIGRSYRGNHHREEFTFFQEAVSSQVYSSTSSAAVGAAIDDRALKHNLEVSLHSVVHACHSWGEETYNTE